MVERLPVPVEEGRDDVVASSEPDGLAAEVDRMLCVSEDGVDEPAELVGVDKGTEPEVAGVVNAVSIVLRLKGTEGELGVDDDSELTLGLPVTVLDAVPGLAELDDTGDEIGMLTDELADQVNDGLNGTELTVDFCDGLGVIETPVGG